MPNTANSDVSTELQSLKEDLAAVRKDLNRVASAAVEQGRDRAYAATDRASAQLENGVNSARDCVHERPLTATFVAFGIGVMLGSLLSPRH